MDLGLNRLIFTATVMYHCDLLLYLYSSYFLVNVCMFWMQDHCFTLCAIKWWCCFRICLLMIKCSHTVSLCMLTETRFALHAQLFHFTCNTHILTGGVFYDLFHLTVRNWILQCIVVVDIDGQLQASKQASKQGTLSLYTTTTKQWVVICHNPPCHRFCYVICRCYNTTIMI